MVMHRTVNPPRFRHLDTAQALRCFVRAGTLSRNETRGRGGGRALLGPPPPGAPIRFTERGFPVPGARALRGADRGTQRRPLYLTAFSTLSSALW